MTESPNSTNSNVQNTFCKNAKYFLRQHCFLLRRPLGRDQVVLGGPREQVEAVTILNHALHSLTTGGIAGH
jgi:hypothetical protein